MFLTSQYIFLSSNSLGCSKTPVVTFLSNTVPGSSISEYTETCFGFSLITSSKDFCTSSSLWFGKPIIKSMFILSKSTSFANLYVSKNCSNV